MFAKLGRLSVAIKADAPILRCLFGVTLSLVTATSLGYAIPHITAVFALMFLEVGKRPLGTKKEILVVLAIGVLGYFGVLVGNYLIDYPLVILPILALVIFWSFRWVSVPLVVRLLFLMLTVLIPFISMKAAILGDVLLLAMLLNLIVALVMVRLSFFLFPWQESETTEYFKEEKKQASSLDLNLDKLAFNGMIVLFPLVFLFYLFNANIAILTLVFVLILGLDPFIYRSKKGTALLLANVIGGVAGILAYNVLVVAPSYLLYILLVLSIGFFFAINLFSGKKIAPVFKIGFNTFFVVMGTISTSSNEAGNTLWERLLQIGLAILYVTMAFKMMNKLNNPQISHG
ncbi:MAG: DUF2955 domain-containing protein [Flavobacteriaceae bacterium]